MASSNEKDDINNDYKQSFIDFLLLFNQTYGTGNLSNPNPTKDIRSDFKTPL